MPDIEDYEAYGSVPPEDLDDDELLSLLAAHDFISEIGVVIDTVDALDEHTILRGEEALLYLNNAAYREEASRRGLAL